MVYAKYSTRSEEQRFKRYKRVLGIVRRITPVPSDSYDKVPQEWQKYSASLLAAQSILNKQISREAMSACFNSRSLLNVTSSRARSRRSPVRSASKSGDDGGGEDSDGGSDPEPPRPLIFTHRLILLAGGEIR